MKSVNLADRVKSFRVWYLSHLQETNWDVDMKEYEEDGEVVRGGWGRSNAYK